MTRPVAVTALGASAAAALLVLLLGAATAMAGGGCHVAEGTRTTEGIGQLVRIEKCVFGPTVLHVSPGTVVNWTNEDPVPHAVTGIGWGSTNLTYSSGTISQRFTTPGIYPYQCYLHPGMSGIVVVGAAGPGLGGGSSAVAPPVTETSSVVAPAANAAQESVMSARAILLATGGVGLAALLLGLLAGYVVSRREIRRRNVRLAAASSEPVA
jgi:plastocyanin